MNNIITDNTAGALRQYLSEGLAAIYDEREASNIISELFQHFLSWSRSDLALNQDQKVSESELLKFHFALKKLHSGEPLQYVLGKCFFYGHQFNVNPSVLIPRPETEELVDSILKTEKRTAPAILDIGTGSGCIAISLKLAKPIARVTGIDISEEALKTAAENAAMLDANVDFRNLNILNEIPEGKFDIIVSNPPYIPHSDKVEMRSQVLKHEPWVALFVEDDDALLFYRRILQLSKVLLNPGGSLWFEIHEDKKEELEHLMMAEHINKATFIKDMQGKERMLHIRFE